jgi:cyanophycinase
VKEASFIGGKGAVMRGLIALVGAGEYLPVMNDVDRYLLSHSSANGAVPRVVCLPTAAGKEGEESWQRWNRMGEEHFRGLGAEVSALPIIDRYSADDERYVETIEKADLIYFSGGNPDHLYETMQGSQAWTAAERAWERGAVYAGCSAGAMILGRHMPSFRTAGLRSLPGFGIISANIIMPHFDQIPRWAPMLLSVVRSRMKDGEFSLGIDEDTALIGKPGEDWHVQGRQKVYVITKKEMNSYSAGEKVPFPA